MQLQKRLRAKLWEGDGPDGSYNAAVQRPTASVCIQVRSMMDPAGIDDFPAARSLADHQTQSMRDQRLAVWVHARRCRGPGGSDHMPLGSRTRTHVVDSMAREVEGWLLATRDHVAQSAVDLVTPHMQHTVDEDLVAHLQPVQVPFIIWKMESHHTSPPVTSMTALRSAQQFTLKALALGPAVHAQCHRQSCDVRRIRLDAYRQAGVVATKSSRPDSKPVHLIQQPLFKPGIALVRMAA